MLRKKWARLAWEAIIEAPGVADSAGLKAFREIDRQRGLLCDNLEIRVLVFFKRLRNSLDVESRTHR